PAKLSPAFCGALFCAAGLLWAGVLRTGFLCAVTLPMAIYLSPAAIAGLLRLNRVAAWERVRDGKFGVPLRRGGLLFVPLAGVEKSVGRQFTHAQLEAAIDGFPDRSFTVQQEDTDTHAEVR